MSYHIEESGSTVFQAETFAVKQAKLLRGKGTKNKAIVINCDSQAAIQAVGRQYKNKIKKDRKLAKRGSGG